MDPGTGKRGSQDTNIFVVDRDYDPRTSSEGVPPRPHCVDPGPDLKLVGNRTTVKYFCDSRTRDPIVPMFGDLLINRES